MNKPLVWTILWLVAYIAARGILEQQTLDTWVRVGAAVLPLPFFALTLATVIRGARQLDELERRIQVEALAFAYVVTMFFLMTVGMLQRAVTLKFEDWSYLHVWAMLPLFYYGGLVLARKRYS
jgi:hypothetical protein